MSVFACIVSGSPPPTVTLWRPGPDRADACRLRVLKSTMLAVPPLEEAPVYEPKQMDTLDSVMKSIDSRRTRNVLVSHQL